MRRIALAAAATLTLTLLSGCSLRPLYGGGSSSAAATRLSEVSVSPIGGQAGWLVRNALIDRIGDHPNGRYKLDILLDDTIEGFGIRPDATTTRERRTLRARYQLIDSSTNQVVLDRTTGWDAGIDVVDSEYATIAAEQTALDLLANRIAEMIISQIATEVARTPAPAP